MKVWRRRFICSGIQAIQSLAKYGCLTKMHVVRLLAPTINGEDHTKAIDFSPSGIRVRSAAGT
jgi:NTE family protein